MGMPQGSKSLKRQDEDFLANIAREVHDLVEKGFYDIDKRISRSPISLRRAIEVSKSPAIITEVKFSSPSLGKIRARDEVKAIVSQMERGGATGISVLTQPIHFKGSLENLRLTRLATHLPILMKDFIIDERQIDAGSGLGADVVLLIERLFSKGGYGSLDSLINFAHKRKLEVLLEVNSRDEFERAARSDADILGINNRDLGSLDLDLATTGKVLSSGIRSDKPIVSESGIKNREEIAKLSMLGVSSFLIGTSIMKSRNIEAKVRELTRLRDKR